MRRLFLILAIIGFCAPSILVAIESIETGNILLYADINATLTGMFANRISTIFTIDLLYTVLIFFVWSFIESRRKGIPRLYLIWALTLLLGLAGGFPLFLYEREKAISAN